MKYPSMIELLTLAEMQLLHDKTVELLESTGILINHDGFLNALEAKGAKVDRSARVVRIPAELTQEAVTTMSRSPCLVLNDPETVREAVKARCEGFLKNSWQFHMGGAGLEVLDEDGRTSRAAKYKDIERVLRFGNGHPRIGTVGGPPLMFTQDEHGRDVPRPLQIKASMAFLVKHCHKLFNHEIQDASDVEFAVALGELVLGGAEAYRQNPILLGVKCSISPLKIEKPNIDVLYELAQRGLPVSLIPMPIAGATAPVEPAANILIANAEIVGLTVALWAVGTESAQSHGVMSGVLDMRTGNACFSHPNIVLQDLSLAQFRKRMYGDTCLSAIDYVDAAYPGHQMASTRALKVACMAACGDIWLGVGQVKAGMVFSPEQACLDIQVFDWMHHFLRGFEISEKTLCVDLIRGEGIGGQFLTADHTVRNFREALFLPELAGLFAGEPRDAIENARAEVDRIVAETPLYRREENLCREIDRLLEEFVNRSA